MPCFFFVCLGNKPTPASGSSINVSERGNGDFQQRMCVGEVVLSRDGAELTHLRWLVDISYVI